MSCGALLAALLVACASGGAQAQTAPVTPAGSAPPFGAAAPMGEADLGKVTGREDTGAMVATATQRNTVSNNSVVGRSTTGNVGISGNAFQNLQGLAVISANSGNNVAINAAMNVTVNISSK